MVCSVIFESIWGEGGRVGLRLETQFAPSPPPPSPSQNSERTPRFNFIIYKTRNI